MITRIPVLALGLVLGGCAPAQDQEQVQQAPDSSAPIAADAASITLTDGDSAQAARARDDSTAFRVFLDSLALLNARLDSVGTDPAAAPILFRLGQLKRHADRWMYYGGPGWQYAERLRDREYYADEANAQFIYKGTDWQRLIQQFPDDTLADDAGWGIAHNNLQGDCEGHVPCYLQRDFVPVLEFLTRFPNSRFDSAAVAEANTALTAILGRVPDLSVADTISRDYHPAPVESLLVRYDSAAARLEPSLQTQVQAVTGPLWRRLGKPRP